MPMLIWIWMIFASIAVSACGSANRTSPPAAFAEFPADIDSESLSRLPLVKRADLDEDGKRIYDMVAGRNRTTPLRGPAGISLYSPRVAEAMHLLNQYLRYESVLGRRLIELAILVTARELDQQFEWSMHETAALNEGVEQTLIDVIKYDRDISGLGEKESLIISFGRELFRRNKLSPDLFARSVELFGRQGTVELAALMGDYALAGIMLHAVNHQLPPDRPALLPLR